jgi:hypothetical protein
MAQGDDNDLQNQIFELLMEKVEADPFPSVTQMNLIEENLRPEQVERYAGALMEKIRADNFPSLDLIQRVIALA